MATRPTQSNGFGFAIAQASVEVEALQQSFVLLTEIPIHDVWQRMVIQYRVSGKGVHDARLVATMIVHGVDRILTFNVADFTRYSEIQALDPRLIS